MRVRLAPGVEAPFEGSTYKPGLEGAQTESPIGWHFLAGSDLIRNFEVSRIAVYGNGLSAVKGHQASSLRRRQSGSAVGPRRGSARAARRWLTRGRVALGIAPISPLVRR